MPRKSNNDIGFLTVPTMFFVVLSASARAHLVPWAVCAALVLCVAEPSVFAWARRRRREEIREVVEATLTPRRRRRA